ncbi:hypothetical protein Kpol_361p3 [Vanderwaltozyma polyspora DSM 70294]|uniref:CAF1B/HIR1 beta-propeller domain-containing protein n=1 Tax=Vanderwaltozyma polyspora (strain ATCC 22028 / DSM 70294 / BCRC 21397 / CBS 2163 / NBRC 10782 / NRRL Y-8283 / UCD 57-17) TaxID=436907 RepID=A7TT42_VANPO|nr:uncharacterized protein Kpol_361p3 [Vanderwaltozyma polyspora DSM 70294]EDO14566.1 hypothetical protein Kpol_361p3 [Vanderwaltozyma polyspora DSM 70294]
MIQAGNLQIYWHESQPIYSLTFQPLASNKKLFTAGGDNKIRIWSLNFNDDRSKIESIDFLSSLTQHEQAVNVVRFNSLGNILASAGDDGQLLLWRLDDETVSNNGVNKENNILLASDEDSENFKESWYVWKRLRSNSASISEIYDICWSPDDRYIVAASMDNSIRIFDVDSTKQIFATNDHNHYVQGVSWDPLNKYIFSLSADRSLAIYEIIFDPNDPVLITNLKLKNRISKGDLPQLDENGTLNHEIVKSSYLFHNETLPSFFRRLAISPCGNLLCVPSGIFRSNTQQPPSSSTSSTTDGNPTTGTNSSISTNNNNSEFANAVYIYTRSSINDNSNRPVLRLPFLNKPAIVISFNPNFYQLSSSNDTYCKLPYKLVFAVATSNEVLIYDTESVKPIAVIGNLHYTPLTDLSWSKDGEVLIVSSTDGFVSYVSMSSDAFGDKLEDEKIAEFTKPENEIKSYKAETNTNSSIAQNKNEIVHILQVKRKQKGSPVKDAKKTKVSETSKSNTTSPVKDKRRVQPILIDFNSGKESKKEEDKGETKEVVKIDTNISSSDEEGDEKALHSRINSEDCESRIKSEKEVIKSLPSPTPETSTASDNIIGEATEASTDVTIINSPIKNPKDTPPS